MENKSLWIKTKITYTAIEVFYLLCNIIGLVVKNHTDDIKA